MHVVVNASGSESGDGEYRVTVTAEQDYTGKFRVTGLPPDRDYTYTAHLSSVLPSAPA